MSGQVQRLQDDFTAARKQLQVRPLLEAHDHNSCMQLTLLMTPSPQ